VQRPNEIAEAPFKSKSPYYSPVRQLELIRNIHFQSLISSALTFPGNGITSLPSVRPMNPFAPRNLLRPYSFKYSDLQSCNRRVIAITGTGAKDMKYLIISGKSCPVPVCSLYGTEIQPGEMGEYTQNELIVQRAVESKERCRCLAIA
jgi:hypothetical protein